MASYQPPSEFLPIFDNSVFTATNGSSTSTGGGLTLAQANLLYLRKNYPDICTALETFNGGIQTTFLNASGNIIAVGDITGDSIYGIPRTTSIQTTATGNVMNFVTNQISGVLNIGTNATRSGNINIGTASTSGQLSLGSSTNTQTNLYGSLIYLANPTEINGNLTISGGGVIVGYLTSAIASATYATIASLSSYLTISSASATYLTQISASTTYATIASLSSYLTIATASATYLTLISASTTYATIASLSAYLTTATAASTYATISSLSSYLTTASAATTYLTITNAASTYATISSLSSYLTSALASTTYLTITNAASTYATISSLSSYLTIASAASTYLTSATAALTYATISSLSSYLTTATAASTYLTITTASTTYLDIITAASTYATIASLSSYLTTATAASTYLTITTASTTYLDIITAASTYATIASLSSYLTTSAAASTYATISSLSSYLTTATAASTYATISSLSSYLTTATAASTYATISSLSSYLTTASAASTYVAITGTYGSITQTLNNYTVKGTYNLNLDNTSSFGTVVIGSTNGKVSIGKVGAGGVAGITLYGDITISDSATINSTADLSMQNKILTCGYGVLSQSLDCSIIDAYNNGAAQALQIGSDVTKTSEIRLLNVTNVYNDINMLIGTNINGGTGTISAGTLTSSGGVNLGTVITCPTALPTFINTSLNYYYNYPSVQSTVTAVSTKYNPVTNTSGGVNYFKAGIYTASIDAVIRFNTGTSAGNYVYNIGVASGTTTGTVTTGTVTNISPSSATVRSLYFGNVLNVDFNNSFTLCFSLSVDSFINIFGNVSTYSNTGGNVLLTLSGCVRRIG
jgi:hypothetical protein